MPKEPRGSLETLTENTATSTHSARCKHGQGPDAAEQGRGLPQTVTLCSQHLKGSAGLTAGLGEALVAPTVWLSCGRDSSSRMNILK